MGRSQCRVLCGRLNLQGPSQLGCKWLVTNIIDASPNMWWSFCWSFGCFSTFWWEDDDLMVFSFIELDYGKNYRKPLYLMVKTMVSCKFSLNPIRWFMYFRSSKLQLDEYCASQPLDHRKPLENLGSTQQPSCHPKSMSFWNPTEAHFTTSQFGVRTIPRHNGTVIWILDWSPWQMFSFHSPFWSGDLQLWGAMRSFRKSVWNYIW